MAELIDHKIIDMPRLWAIGVQVHVLNQGDNPLPAEWRKQFEAGLFDRLNALPGAYSADTFGVIHSWPGDMSCFEYVIGMLFTELPDELPEGCVAHELEEGRMLCGYVRGRDASYVIAGAHDLVMARADKSGYEFDIDRLCLIEGYNCPRFTQPDDQGRIIFDYYIPVVKKSKK